ncbi:hypothetical protein NC651_016729 [Populus alba x Populus x berolinensis]|nr:hypothetical protein NC651_016729 [Populus alba x Populus x berolinensis]
MGLKYGSGKTVAQVQFKKNSSLVAPRLAIAHNSFNKQTPQPIETRKLPSMIL